MEKALISKVSSAGKSLKPNNSIWELCSQEWFKPHGLGQVTWLCFSNPLWTGGLNQMVMLSSDTLGCCGSFYCYLLILLDSRKLKSQRHLISKMFRKPVAVTKSKSSSSQAPGWPKRGTGWPPLPHPLLYHWPLPISSLLSSLVC